VAQQRIICAVTNAEPLSVVLLRVHHVRREALGKTSDSRCERRDLFIKLLDRRDDRGDEVDVVEA